MKSDVLAKFEDDILVLALKGIDKDKMAEKFRKQLEKVIDRDFQEAVNELDLASWITSELEDQSNPAGKLFQKSITAITQKMASSISS